MILSLYQLRAHAATKPDLPFNLDNATNCLACQTAQAETGKPHEMEGYQHFSSSGSSGDYFEVDSRFAGLCRSLRREQKTSILGRDLVTLIDRLIADVHPFQVAEEYADAL